MESAIESMWVGCFECTGCIIAILPNDMHYYKTKPYGIPIGSFTVPKVAENAEANDEEDEESSALDEELIMINDEGV